MTEEHSDIADKILTLRKTAELVKIVNEIIAPKIEPAQVEIKEELEISLAGEFAIFNREHDVKINDFVVVPNSEGKFFVEITDIKDSGALKYTDEQMNVYHQFFKNLENKYGISGIEIKEKEII